MNNLMLGLFNLGGGEIILILSILMMLGAGAVVVVVGVLWLLARQRNSPRTVPPVQPASSAESARSGACPKCGASLTAEAPQGLCPRCLLGVGLATHTEAPGESGPHGTKVVQPPLAPGDIASHFPQLEILDCLGRGGMGVVYKARQPKLNRLVALKILASEKGADPRFAERFLREAQALARLSHPNIVTVHDFGEADGLYYLLMEYVDGVTLRQLLQTRRIAPEEALGIVPKICEALQFAHELGVVHRDIKPENVLLDKQGRVKIADFGIAKLVGAADQPLTSSRSPSDAARVSGGPGEGTLTQDQVLGTPHYMAPEQVETPQLVDHRADIYSLGVVFYEMLTGELPLGKFQRPSKKVQVDVRLDEVVMHALEKEPARRYQHASEVKTDVETIAAGRSAPAPTDVPVRVLGWRDLWPWDTTYITTFLIAPMLGVAILVSMLLPQHASKVPWFLGCTLLGVCAAAGHAAVGYRIRRLKAALRRPTGEIADCLIYRKPFKTPGLAVLHADRLELIPISGPPMTVALAHIVAVAEVSWFVAQFLWWKQGFVLELANGRRVGVAVAEPFARRWRARLSRGSLPEIRPDSEPAAGAAPTGTSGGVSVGSPRFSRAAILGVSWLLICAVAQVWSYTPPGWALNQALRAVFGDFLAGGLKVLFLVVGFAAPVGITVFGWVATTEIRRSGGRVRGLGLASGEMVLFPLLALDGWLLWLCSQTGLKLFIGAAVVVAADALLVCWVWRWVRRPLAAAESTPVRPEDDPAATVPLASQLWRVARRAALVAALSLLLLETLLQLSVGWRESTGELWTMALYSACLAAMVWAAWPLRRQPWTVLLRAGAAFALFAAVSVASGFYTGHLRPNLGLYREPDWVAQHPAFQREWRQRLEKNLWRKPAVGPTQASAFGPVIERVLNDPDDQPREETLRIATGGLSTELTGAEKKGGGRIRRLVASPGDLYAEFDDYVGSRWALITAGLALSDLSPRQWETATGSEVRRALELRTVVPHVEQYGAILYLLPEGLLPMTFGFRTRQGDCGVIQVTGFTDNPRGVKIRYKLLE